MRVAVEYAGRWYDRATIPWLENHHENIVVSSPLCTTKILYFIPIKWFYY